MPPDQELLQRARHFENQALSEIYDLYSPGLQRYAVRLLGDPNLAEDCVAETFSKFLLAMRDRRGPDNHLQAYLYRVLHNLIVDHYRRGPIPGEELKDEIRDEHPGLEHEAQQRSGAESLRKALQQLTPDQQQVILLKFMEDWDNESIARAMEKPVGAVKSLQHRALAALKRSLKDEERQ